MRGLQRTSVVRSTGLRIPDWGWDRFEAGTGSKLAKAQSEDDVASIDHTIATRDVKARHTVKPITLW